MAVKEGVANLEISALAAIEVRPGTWFSAILSSFGGHAFVHYVLILNGTEHIVPFAKWTLIPVKVGENHVEMYYRGRWAGKDKRQDEQKKTITVAGGTVLPICYQLRPDGISALIPGGGALIGGRWV